MLGVAEDEGVGVVNEADDAGAAEELLEGVAEEAAGTEVAGGAEEATGVEEDRGAEEAEEASDDLTNELWARGELLELVLVLAMELGGALLEGLLLLVEETAARVYKFSLAGPPHSWSDLPTHSIPQSLSATLRPPLSWFPQ